MHHLPSAHPIATPWQIFVMAMMAGVTLANIYYCQPILAQIAASLGTSPDRAGLLPVLTQLGYGIGLFFIAPLGDIFDRKKLVITLQILLIITLIITTRLQSLYSMMAVVFATGLLAVSVQIVVPMAASLASPETKGKVVGMVFTGSLTGILSARVFSGLTGEWLSWQWVYALSALMVAVVSLLFWRCLPTVKPAHSSRYSALLVSTLHQAVRFGQLRRLSLLGALSFGAFSAFWTTLALHLAAKPFGYKSDVIGLFGLLALVGTLLTPWLGRLSDRISPPRIQVLSLVIMTLASLISGLWPVSLIAMIAVTLLLDVGMQATQVNNLSQIYRLDESAHSRINTFFMSCFFWGGALGTLAGVMCWKLGGWRLVSWQLFIWTLTGLLVTLRAVRRSKPAVPPGSHEPLGKSERVP